MDGRPRRPAPKVGIRPKKDQRMNPEMTPAKTASTRNVTIGTRPSIFIASSNEGRDVGRHLQAALQHVAEPTLWDQSIFKLSEGALDSLLGATGRFDFAVCVLTPDDFTHSRGVEQLAPRDNLVFELGMFYGALGRDRVVAVQPRGEMRLPSDMLGVTTSRYDANRRDANLRAAIDPVALELESHFLRIGVRATIPTGARRSVAISNRHIGHMEIFWLGDGGAVLARYWGGARGWSAPYALGAPTAVSLAVVSQGDTKQVLFGLDDRGRVWQREWIPIGNGKLRPGPAEWLPGEALEPPLAADSLRDNHFELAAWRADGTMVHSYFGGDQWYGWSSDWWRPEPEG
jgi:predicted nucleotide-binding protein